MPPWNARTPIAASAIQTLGEAPAWTVGHANPVRRDVETSTMLMTRVTDLRTPSSRTEDFYEALKVRKVPTAMMEHNMAV
jgi:hypothetical protein